MRKRSWSLTLRIMLLGVLLGLPTAGAVHSLSDQPDTASRIADIVNALSPEQRVGQLFVVTFDGSKVEPENPVYGLIERYGIGGIMLRRSTTTLTIETTW